MLELSGPVEPEAELALGEKKVGRVTSVADGLALAYVRVEVPEDAVLSIDGVQARLH